jgi:hypothetical protein
METLIQIERSIDPLTSGITTIRRARNRARCISLGLALVLPLLRLSRAFGQENDVGYRLSYYQEDNNRIKVDTDLWQYNVKFSDNVSMNGNVVIDAISGATPTGAPPQTKWPFQTQASLYQSAYQTAYASQYAQNIAQNQDLYNGGYITYQQLTNGAAVYANQTAPSIATNSAAASYQSLTNNPNYRNNKVPLTHMHDYRTAFSLNLPLTFGVHQISPSFSYSEESDYISYAGALNYSISLNDKNTVVSAGWAHNTDSVRNDLFVFVPKNTDNMFVGFMQLFGPKAYLTVNASLSFERGYLADPYRGVMLASELQSNPSDPALSPEVRPRHRNSQILYVAWDQFITPLNGSYELSYRFFHDTYGIFANTAELDWHQKIGKHVVVTPMFRYYVQNAADFYYILVPDNNNVLPGYYSSDYRLSQFESFATGVTVTWRVYKHLSFDASYMRYVMRGLDGATSQSAYPSANVYSLGLRLWF